MARREVGGAVVHRHQLAELRIARQLPDRRAVGGETIEATVHARHHDRDHLALELAQAGGRQHQVVVEGHEGFELGVVERIGVSTFGTKPIFSRHLSK